MSTNNKNRLGKGLDSLIPTDIDEFLHSDTPAEITAKGASIEDVEIEKISANPHQPRHDFERGNLAELADSIRVHGVLQPIILIKHGGSYELVAGERRLRAAKLAGLAKIPAVIRSMESQEQLEVALIENIQRADLSLLEQAAAYRALNQQFGLNMNEISQRVGKAPQTVNNMIRLLNLPKEAKDALGRGLIVEGHARTLLTASSDPAQQQHMLSMIIKRGLTVRQAEELARNFKTDKVVDEKKVTEGSETERTIITNLGKLFRVPVRIQKTARGGKLVIEFTNERQLKKITDRILG